MADENYTVIDGNGNPQVFSADDTGAGVLAAKPILRLATGTVSAGNPVPVTAASLPLPTGAATETTLASIDTKVATESTLVAIETLLSGTLTVTGPLTDAQLRASPVPVTGAVSSLPYLVSTNNSTTAQLGNGAVFTGTGEDVSSYGTVSIFIYSDQNSAASGLQFQASHNNSTWRTIDSYSYVSGVARQYNIGVQFRYFRLVYTNGTTLTTALQIQVIYHTAYVNPQSHRIGDSITSENDAGLTKAVLTGLAPSGSFVNVQTNNNGRLFVTNDAVFVDDAAFSIGSDSVGAQGYLFDDVAPDSVNEGDIGIARMSANRVPYAQLRDAAGNERGANVNASNALLVAQTGAIPAGANTIGAVTQSGSWTLDSNSGVDIGDVTVNNDGGSSAVNIQDGGNSLTVDNNGTFLVQVSSALPAGANTIGAVNLAQYTPASGRLPVDGSGVTQPVSGTVTVTATNLDIRDLTSASDSVSAVVPVATSGGPANVSSSATNVTLLASNSSRKGFSIMNDSTEILYVKFGATASATSFHVKMQPGTYYESNAGYNYTGIIDGIWASANGAARMGEFT